ncbi:hypothetical protein Moror_11008 [Moniliophthora roreri MCA 2997]|uniref:Uncharacterized protein n=1 Tax=Moniliophthora roreri (strain MCA 2997) TaxID=1381753 RepID=V2WY32_MONRO|nr:hypothetical protein Moror_11008 [Moniliophthora roreri MCA 2997]
MASGPLPESSMASDPDISKLSSKQTLSPGASEDFSTRPEDITEVSQKKRKKKKPKKSASAKAKEAAEKAAKTAAEASKPAVLCISRNKHWKYISSYHGPWLQLPLELLESLLLLNLDPATLSPTELQNPIPPPISPNTTPTSFNIPQNIKSRSKDKDRDRGFHALSSNDSTGTFTNPSGLSININANNAFPLPPPLPTPEAGKAPPPPIDPGVFRNVTSIRRLIDEAAELSVRASSGLSAAELGSMRSSGGGYGAWNAAQTLGINPMGNIGGGGRNVAMSAMRIHRLRALAVQKLAQAYKADEIASSVMVMQGGSVFDDVAEKVLRVDPNDIDAKYVHFFHEKIPSRQLAESTNTQILDELIHAQPQRLEFYRTRGIVHCFRDEYSQATKDFTFALKEARAARKAKMSHVHGDSVGNASSGGGGKSGKLREGKSGKGKSGKKKRNAQTQDGASSLTGGADNGDEDEDGSETPSTTPSTPHPPGAALHPSALADAPDPLEPQLLFLRGAAYLSHAVHLIESTVLELEGVVKAPTLDGAELRLCYLEDGKYGGVEVGNPDGPLGKTGGEKIRRYREVLAESNIKNGKRVGFREKVENLLKKSLRDHERFLSHFDTLESGPAPISLDTLRKKQNEEYSPTLDKDTLIREGQVELLSQTEYAFYLSESIRPGNQPSVPPSPVSPYSPVSSSCYPQFPDQSSTAMFTTYHPLLVESHFSILLCLLLLGDFATILPTFSRTATLVDGLEGYPVFLPPRSMAQAEFIEVLERLAGGWSLGCKMSWAERARLRMEREADEGRMIEGGSIVEADDDQSTTPTLSSNGQLHFSLGESSSSSSSAPSLAATPSRSNTPVDSTIMADANTNTWVEPREDAVEALECTRILLAPVIARQRERAEKAKAERAERAAERARATSTALVKARGGQEKGLVHANGSEIKQKKPVPINIPLHGPRVEVVLAWLGAVHLPELEGGDVNIF